VCGRPYRQRSSLTRAQDPHTHTRTHTHAQFYLMQLVICMLVIYSSEGIFVLNQHALYLHRIKSAEGMDPEKVDMTLSKL
jgi:hypothetical protein